LRFTRDGSDHRRAVLTIADMLHRKIDGDNPEPGEWTAARAAAAWVAARTVGAAARAAEVAAWAAEAASHVARASAWSAAGATEAAAHVTARAAEVAVGATWVAIADKLVELLGENN